MKVKSEEEKEKVIIMISVNSAVDIDLPADGSIDGICMLVLHHKIHRGAIFTLFRETTVSKDTYGYCRFPFCACFPFYGCFRIVYSSRSGLHRSYPHLFRRAAK